MLSILLPIYFPCLLCHFLTVFFRINGINPKVSVKPDFFDISARNIHLYNNATNLLVNIWADHPRAGGHPVLLLPVDYVENQKYLMSISLYPYLFVRGSYLMWLGSWRLMASSYSQLRYLHHLNFLVQQLSTKWIYQFVIAANAQALFLARGHKVNCREVGVAPLKDSGTVKLIIICS